MEKDYNNNENMEFDYNDYMNGMENGASEETAVINDFVVTEYENDESERDDYLFYDNDEEEEVAENEETSPGRMIVGGLIIFAIGLTVTLVSYNSGGNSYIICYGAIISGIVSFFKGLASLGS